MTERITVSDEVYRRLQREKGDRSISDLIETRLDAGGELADVTGQEIFAPGTFEDVKDDVSSLSDGPTEG
jgi:predicted CopG family antitoxin